MNTEKLREVLLYYYDDQLYHYQKGEKANKTTPVTAFTNTSIPITHQNNVLHYMQISRTITKII